MGNDMSDRLDAHITGNYGEDQFTPLVHRQWVYPNVQEAVWALIGYRDEFGYDPDEVTGTFAQDGKSWVLYIHDTGMEVHTGLAVEYTEQEVMHYKESLGRYTP